MSEEIIQLPTDDPRFPVLHGLKPGDPAERIPRGWSDWADALEDADAMYSGDGVVAAELEVPPRYEITYSDDPKNDWLWETDAWDDVCKDLWQGQADFYAAEGMSDAEIEAEIKHLVGYVLNLWTGERRKYPYPATPADK